MSQQTDQKCDEDGSDSGWSADEPVEATAAPSWLIDYRRSSFSKGFYESLGDHALLFTERGSDRLVIGFDNLASVRDHSIGREPWGYGFVARNGWSYLGVMAFRPGWFRDVDLFAALIRLEQAGFFRRFRSVTMTGTSMGGYAACAFSSLAPGCNVIAFSPQSTLRSDLVPWEDRFGSGRRADWSGPFADGAAVTGAAAKMFLVHDPFVTKDRMHVERFQGANIVPLRARHGGHKTALSLRRAKILGCIVAEAVENRLTEAGFYAHYRQTCNQPWFANGLAERAFAAGRPDLVGRIFRHLHRNGHGPAAHVLRKRHIRQFGTDPMRQPASGSLAWDIAPAMGRTNSASEA